MGTNEGWPEAFGFSVTGDVPVLIGEVEQEGSAQQAGLQTGDVIIELDGENVERWTRDQVIARARCASKVPPSLIVMSRIRRFKIRRAKDGGYGFTIRGNAPVFVRSVDFPSSARTAGVRSGDLLLEINQTNIRFSTKLEVLDLLRRSGRLLHLTVVAGGMKSISHVSSSTVGASPRRVARSQKAQAFHSKINYYLMDDDDKKINLLTLLRLYAKDRDIHSLGSSLNILLDTPIERRLLADIRTFIQPKHQMKFDALVSYTPSFPSKGLTSHRRGSVEFDSIDGPHPLSGLDRDVSWRSSMPNLMSTGERIVQVYRGNGGFGFTLSGNAPVFIRSVDPYGAAARAGLRAGDYILQLNGLNVRDSTHSHVVRLLRGSGTRPALIVSSLPSSHSPSFSAVRHSIMPAAPVNNGDIKKNSQAFKEKMDQVLFEEERQQVIQQLSQFSQHKDLPGLVQGLGTVLKDQKKTVLFHYICQLLPEETQHEFDRIAAEMLAGGSPPLSSGNPPVPQATIASQFQSGQMRYRGNATMASTLSAHPGESIGPYMGRNSGPDNQGDEGMILSDTPIRGTSGHHNMSSNESYSNRGTFNLSGSSRISDYRGQPEGIQATPTNSNSSNAKTPNIQDVVLKPTSQATPVMKAVPGFESSTISTPGSSVPCPPNPPPTPQGGVGGVPVPPPPPPALPGAMSSQTHLKRVNWEKVHSTEGTIWKELSALEEALEYCEIEEKFSSQKPKEAVREKKEKQASVLEPRKAYNIAILLGHLKLPFSQIREAVLACDSDVLSEQHLRQMEAFAPSKQECLGFARYHDNPKVLSLPDQFSCEMSTIPYYHERLKAMVFKLHFKEKVDEIKPDLEAISLASVQLQSSKKFKRVLEIVLAVGNYMNAGNVRVGGAAGFKVHFLTRLKELRTTDNKSTLLHFVANTVERKFPQVLEFPDDLSFMNKAARVSGQTLEIEISELSQGLNDIRRDIHELAKIEKLPGDRFQEVMTAFLSEADAELASLLKLYSHMKKECQQAMKFFGEEPAKMRIDDFFSSFAAFITDFEKAVQDNKTAREKQVLQEKRLQEREELFKKKRMPPAMAEQYPVEVDLKKELEAKSQTKSSSAISTLEIKMKSKPKTPEQKDFRHLLHQRQQQPDHLTHHHPPSSYSHTAGGHHHGHHGRHGNRREEKRVSGSRQTHVQRNSRTQPEYDSETIF